MVDFTLPSSARHLGKGLGGMPMTLLLLTCLWGPVSAPDPTTSAPAEVRLVNGTSPCSGRVEVLHNGQWGTVCHDDWGMEEARVVCRQLGCATALSALPRAHFGRGTGPIWMDDVRCKGTESMLSQCPASPWGDHKCNHGEDASVICAEIRLVGGSSTCTGRVEVFHSPQWGTVCDNGWDINDARVVCLEMGCGNVIAAPGGAKFGQGSGPSWMDGVNCTGSENSLRKCPANPLAEHSCDHSKDAGVECAEPPGIRLAEGPNHCSGRVEILEGQTWGTVCDDDWDLEDAKVVCRFLGCGMAVSAPRGSHFGAGSGPIHPLSVYCIGDEKAISECFITGVGMSSCGHGGVSGVICSGADWVPEPTTPEPTGPIELRLVNGTSPCSGRVEVLHNGQWGTVCDYGWDMEDAGVVCRQVGCMTALSALPGAHFGRGTGPIWLDHVRCNGMESTLSQCLARPWGDNSCHHGYDASVICTDIRLVGGSDPCSGRVEVFHNQQWGTVCDNGWDINDARVACLEAGCGNAIAAPGGAKFGKGYGPSWMVGVNCTGSEESLSKCPANPLAEHSCDHSKDAGVECAEPPGIRLAEGPSHCSGRVEIFLDQTWGTICDSYWDPEEANVVCRFLGCGMAVSSPRGSHFGTGSGRIHPYRIYCTGYEQAISECFTEGGGLPDCSHSEEAGVICSEVRLVGSSDPCSGRVEVLHNEQWGTVCDNDWDINDARVACLEAGCGNVIAAPGGAKFGKGSGPSWMDGVNCTGSENSLSKCPANPLAEHSCDHSKDAGVECADAVPVPDPTTSGPDKLRLVNGTSPCSGRVEVLHNGQWGTVCHDDWGMEEAQVVCRQVGCMKALSALPGAHFGRGTGRIWLDDVRCEGTESTLSQCPARSWGYNNCNHGKDASVICAEIRLVGGSSTCTGRVEVLHNEQWGTVCDNGWDINDARVACLEVGCGNVIAAPGGAKFGQGSGPSWMDGVNCTGSESSLSKCPANPLAEHSCGHSKDAGVECAEPPGIRLAEGPTHCSGRVEIFLDQTWGTMCDSYWHPEEANVVCHYLGCGMAVSAPGGSHFGAGSGHIHPYRIYCTGSEKAMSECFTGAGMSTCGHSEEAGVICSDIRLINGSNRCSGRVEVYHNKQWGTICDDSWDLQDAEVVCREMHCGKALAAISGAHYSQGSGPIWLDQVNCMGKEDSVKDCQARPWGEHSCDHRRDASVECSDPHEIRLVNGTGRCSGRVEVFRNHQWGTVCDDGWDMNSAQVVCRELDCGKAISAPQGAHFGNGTDRIWLDDVKCQGNEAALTDCRLQPWGTHNCHHGEDASVVCSGKGEQEEHAEERLTPSEDPRSALSTEKHLTWEQQRQRCVSLFTNLGQRLLDREDEDLRQCRSLIESMLRSDKESTRVIAKRPGFGYPVQGRNKLPGSRIPGAMFAFAVPSQYLEEGFREKTVTLLLLASLWGVAWGSDPDTTSDTAEIRLVNGYSRCSGRVEMFHNGNWGTVCDDNWDLEDARVVCRQLGCSTAISAPHGAHFGRGTGNIWLDNVECSGTELALSQCPARPLGENDCHHGEDAGVVCSELRLAGSSTQCAGRVEIFHNQQWGTVCGNGWNLKNARVVCREMGCGKALTAPTGAKFGQASGPTWMDGLNCTGEEETLRKCPAKPLAEYSCDQSMHAGVECEEPPEIRLVQGDRPCSGRVEIFHEGLWGTICDGSWDLEDAEVVCRYLGCGTALSAPRGSRFGDGAGPVWLDGINCTGKENAVSKCPAKEWGTHDCTHSEEAGVVCAVVRLMSGSNRCSGRVEVYYNDQWGTVCDSEWDSHDAQVVCRELGCGNALTAIGGARFGQGSGTIWLDNVRCTGKEKSLRACPKRPWGEHSCDHRRDASVECSDPHEIRLVNGSNRCSGRVEVLHNQQWGTVCDDDWNILNAQVVCRELECGVALLAPSGAHFGEGADQIWLDDVKCQGNEAALRDCRLKPWGQNNCNHKEDASVVCSELKLVNGSNRCSGRVEIFHRQQWGTVCDDRWGMKQAEVICKEMGCGVALRAPKKAFFGQGSGPIWKDDVNCVGTEVFFSECTSSPWGLNNCHHGEDAGVECAVPAEIRLVNGSSRCSGRVEVLHLQQYGTVCDDGWDMNEALVVCRNLDCGTAIAAPHGAQFGQGEDPIWMDDLECTGTESALTECRMRPWGANDCGHREDASVICSEDLRLINGSNRCSGRVEIRPPHSEQWGTICDRTWDVNDAAVVCRQLGCGNVMSAPQGAHFGGGSGPIWMDNINCKGKEEALADCVADTRGNNDCTHGQDAAVICAESSFINVGDIRLVNSAPNVCAGRVEVLYQQQWGTVCDDGWDLEDATVVCKQMGCGFALKALDSAHFGEGSGAIWLDDMNCTGSETALKDCKGQGVGEHNCNHAEDAGVLCSGLFQVRLADGPNSCAGRVEMMHNGSWASIGEHGWSLKEATVVCRQLGCGAAVSAPVGNQYGAALRPALLDEIKCTGQESALSQCQGKGPGPHKCLCDAYAGAVCAGTTGSSVAVTVILVLGAAALLLGGFFLYRQKRRTGKQLCVNFFTRTQNAFAKDIAFQPDRVNGAPDTCVQEGAVHELDSDTVCLVKATSASPADHNN
ncbi:scavenger receptor cysteine-rich domain-containing protein DMBT1-like [Paroedura picta]|uniref:scavenger receptor cysteine-rich domain-containing protein DMBT1-like n=1 Tax=Paroedura picta TaxID=143630 RepID=UPI004055EF3E